MQMQWQHQVCASELPDGVAVSFSKETLRALQNAISLHKALPSADAVKRSYTGLPPASHYTYVEIANSLVTYEHCRFCLAWLASLVNANRVEGSLLDR